MSAVEVIAEALHRFDCGCTDWHPRDVEDPSYDDQAAAVVAAVRGMDADTLAELIGGYVAQSLATVTWRDGHAIPATRVVGPWQETQP